MPEIEVLSEHPLTLAEVREFLEKMMKGKDEPGFREKKTEEYLKLFAKQDVKKAQELKKKLEGLGIQRLKEKQIVKLIDLMPRDVDSVRVVLSSDDISLKQEDINKIVECLK